MKKVYICSAFASSGTKVGNLIMARFYSETALRRGYLPIAPHLMYGEILQDDYPEDREMALAAGLELLEMCDEIWIFGPVAGGMINEVKKAEEMGLVVRFICKDGSDWIWPKASYNPEK